ncbi:MAG: WhiB family transcriptional regulator [Actinomycetota bacterium]|nr:WhiB family transcriptional regulator [Actinomycetota bacterium]
MTATQTTLIQHAWVIEGQERAACRGADVELFFSVDEEDQQRALEYCACCEVWRQCLEFAIANREVYGIWGGLRESERRALIRDFRRREREERERGKRTGAAA